MSRRCYGEGAHDPPSANWKPPNQVCLPEFSLLPLAIFFMVLQLAKRHFLGAPLPMLVCCREKSRLICPGGYDVPTH
jgi:hypothetical protein